jgi:mannose-6-phosphate isomerase
MSVTTGTIWTRATEFEERPWGSWQVIDVGSGYKVKRIKVNPHSRLSLQRHVHRSEHWGVVQGLATCTVGEHQILAGKEAQIDVPCGAAHRIANDQDDELVIIEIQVGSYTGEDDIVRLQDDYGRR